MEMNLDIYRYAKKYFQMNFLEWYLMSNMQRNGFSSCINQLSYNSDKIRDMENGLYDDELFQLLNEYVNRFFTDGERKDCYMLYEYICNISNNLSCLNFSNSIKKYINKLVMTNLFPQYNLSKLGDDNFEQIIVKEIKKIYDELYNSVFEKVKLYLNKNIEIYEILNNKFNMDDMLEYIVSKMFINYDYHFIMNVKNMRIDDFIKNDNIESVIFKYKNEYMLSFEKNNSINKDSNGELLYDVNYVYEYVKNIVLIHYPDSDEGLLNTCTTVVYNNLIKNGYNANEIVGTNMRKVIISYVNEFFVRRELSFNMMENSVKKDNVFSKIKANRNTINISSTIVGLALVATLVGVVGYDYYQDYVDNRNENIIENVSVMDNYRYSNISNIHMDVFKRTSNNLINTFDEYCKFDDKNFHYLGFYQTYREIDQNSLYVMDKMLVQIEKDTKNDIEHRNLYNVIRYNACYLDFMYDRLYEMGFEEVKDKKYQDLLSIYIKLRYAHPYDDLYEYLLPAQRKLLDKVKDKYDKLSCGYLVQLGELLGNEEYQNDVVRGKSKS